MCVEVNGEVFLTSGADRRRRTWVVQGIVVKQNEHLLFDQFFSLSNDSREKSSREIVDWPFEFHWWILRHSLDAEQSGWYHWVEVDSVALLVSVVWSVPRLKQQRGKWSAERRDFHRTLSSFRLALTLIDVRLIFVSDTRHIHLIVFHILVSVIWNNDFIIVLRLG